MQDLAVAAEECDVEKFTDAVAEYDSVCVCVCARARVFAVTGGVKS